MLKRVLCKIIGVFLAFYSLAFLGAGIIILTSADIGQGKLLGFIIAVVMGILLGFGAWKLFRVSRKPVALPVVIGDEQSEPVPEQPSFPTPRPIPVPSIVQRQEVPRQVLSEMRVKNVPKCNCDGCIKQEECEYGHIVYDEITNERLSLADKFMIVGIFDFDKSSYDFGNVATNEELYNKKLLLKLEKDVLHNMLNYLQEMKKAYYEFGKCGKAYFNYMKMGDEISLVKEVIREYDEYQVVLKQIDLAKSYVLDRADKEREFQQEEVYKIFPDIDRKNVTNAIRELEKSKCIIRERYGKTYIIRKNNA